MKISETTTLTEIVEQYGEIPEVMKAFGIREAEDNPLRRKITMGIAVERAARIQGTRLSTFLEKLNEAIRRHSAS